MSEGLPTAPIEHQFDTNDALHIPKIAQSRRQLESIFQELNSNGCSSEKLPESIYKALNTAITLATFLENGTDVSSGQHGGWTFARLDTTSISKAAVSDQLSTLVAELMIQKNNLIQHTMGCPHPSKPYREMNFEEAKAFDAEADARQKQLDSLYPLDVSPFKGFNTFMNGLFVTNTNLGK